MPLVQKSDGAAEVLPIMKTILRRVEEAHFALLYTLPISLNHPRNEAVESSTAYSLLYSLFTKGVELSK